MPIDLVQVNTIINMSRLLFDADFRSLSPLFTELGEKLTIEALLAAVAQREAFLLQFEG